MKTKDIKQLAKYLEQMPMLIAAIFYPDPLKEICGYPMYNFNESGGPSHCRGDKIWKLKIRIDPNGNTFAIFPMNP